MNKKKKKYWDMTAEELTEATREFDAEHVAETFRDLTPAEEMTWRAAVDKRPSRRKAPVKGVTIVAVEIEPGLLKRADALAKKRGVSRARLVAEGLEALLTSQGT